MFIYPPVTFSLLNGFLLMIPLLALRFGIPALIRKDALGALAFFPPVRGFERIALKVYFVTNTYLIFSPLLARIQTGTRLSAFGLIIYGLGLTLLSLALIEFSMSDGIRQEAIYRFSRNPVCFGYFLIFIGTSLIIGSWLHLGLTVVYQVAVHGLILSEERWCLENFGRTYRDYLDKTPRYL